MRSLRSLHRRSSSVLIRTVNSVPFWTNTIGKVVSWCPDPNSEMNSLLSRVRDGISRSFKNRFHSFFIPTGLWVIVRRVRVPAPEAADVPAEKSLSDGNTPLSVLSTIRRIFDPGIYDPSPRFHFLYFGIPAVRDISTSVITYL